MSAPATGGRPKSTPSAPGLEEFARYLDLTGWARQDGDARSRIWRRTVPGEDSLVVVLPMDGDWTDYDEHARAALRTVSWAERRQVNEIADDIALGGADSVSVRLYPDTPSGEAPLGLTKKALTALRDYIVASASAALLTEPTLVLPTRRPVRAESYADRVRLSTHPGSFILSLSLPLGEDEVERLDGMDPRQGILPPLGDDPFGRKVRMRMSNSAERALRLAEEVAAGDERVEAFGYADSNAPNATELAALGNLGGVDFRPYEIQFRDSPLLPSAQLNSRFRVTPGQQHVLLDAADFLRTKRARSVTILGLVVKLERVGNMGTGEIVIQGPDDDTGIERRDRLDLVEAEYNEAVRAHQHGLRVSVSGELKPRGTRKRIGSPLTFAVIPGQDED